MNQRISLMLASAAMLMTGWCSMAQTQPSPPPAPATQPATLPAPDTELPRIRAGRSVSINGSPQAESRQGWPLLIEVRGSTTAPASIEIIGADGKAVAWIAQSLPVRPGRFTWGVAPEQTQSAPSGEYHAVVRFGKTADSESVTARLTLVAATEAVTASQKEQLPYLLATYHVRRGDPAAAKLSVEDALKAAPQDIGLLILRGDVLMASGEFNAAAAAYSQAMDARAKLVTDDDDDPPVILMAKWRAAMRKAGEGKELLNDKPK